MPKKFKHSDTILLKCKDGYFKSGIGALKCKKGDNWTGGITCSREFLLCCPYSLTKHVFLEKRFVLVSMECINLLGEFYDHCHSSINNLESTLVVAHLKEYYLRSFDHRHSWC